MSELRFRLAGPRRRCCRAILRYYMLTLVYRTVILVDLAIPTMVVRPDFGFLRIAISGGFRLGGF